MILIDRMLFCFRYVVAAIIDDDFCRPFQLLWLSMPVGWNELNVYNCEANQICCCCQLIFKPLKFNLLAKQNPILQNNFCPRQDLVRNVKNICRAVWKIVLVLYFSLLHVCLVLKVCNPGLFIHYWSGWPDYFFNIWPMTILKNCPIAK